MRSLINFSCYMLKSKNPKYPRTTYIGFTHNLYKRFREHNGDIVRGAKQTQKARPWEMIISVTGFDDKINGLKFEWAWQHPFSSNLLMDSNVVNDKRKQELSSTIQDYKNTSMDFRIKVLLELLKRKQYFSWKLLKVYVYKKKLWEIYFQPNLIQDQSIKMNVTPFSKRFYKMKKKIRKKVILIEKQTIEVDPIHSNQVHNVYQHKSIEEIEHVELIEDIHPESPKYKHPKRKSSTLKKKRLSSKLKKSKEKHDKKTRLLLATQDEVDKSHSDDINKPNNKTKTNKVIKSRPKKTLDSKLKRLEKGNKSKKSVEKASAQQKFSL